MANLSRCARDELVPAWQVFVNEALPAGQVSAAAAAVAGLTGGSFAKTPTAAFLRRIANGGVAQPEATSVWYAAEAARTIADRAWCAGPLFLFAAGHFELFARTLLDAPRDLVSHQRKLSLISATTSACSTETDPSLIDIETRLRSYGVAETVARKHLRKQNLQLAVRPERNTWILTAEEAASFEQAFLSALNTASCDPASVASRLAAMHPEIGLALQRRIVIGVLSFSIWQ